MKRATTLAALTLLVALAASAEWTTVEDGVEYQRFNQEAMDVHVTRIDLTNPKLKVIATREDDRGLTVSDFAKKNKAVAAINADYFDKEMKPIGLTIGPCGVWE